MSGRAVAAALILMTRPAQLLLVIAVAALGVLVASARGADPDLGAVAIGMAVLLAFAASIHLANEFADHVTDARTVRTPFSGGSGALQRYPVDRRLAIAGARILAAVGIVVALPAWLSGLIPGIALGVALIGLALGWAYSIGPWPLAWHGWGEATNALLGGMLLPLYGVTLAGGALDATSGLAFAPFTTLVFANLLATTWPDRRADASVGKATLATRWSPRRLRIAYLASLVLGGGALVISAGLGVPPAIGVAAISVLPVTAWAAWAYMRIETPLPTVLAMCWLLVATAAAWLVV